MIIPIFILGFLVFLLCYVQIGIEDGERVRILKEISHKPY